MSDPPVKIIDRDFGDETLLFNVQENMNTRRGKLNVNAIYSEPSAETFIISLEEQGQLQINGLASGIRISGYDRYSDDPLTALAEYAARLLAHVNGQQGIGWTVENSYTGRSIDCVVESVEIIRERTEKYEFEFALTVRVGRGLMPASPLKPERADPSTTAKLAGQDLREIEQLMITKSQKVKVHTYALHDADENEVEAKTGARRRITLKGNVPGDEADRKVFDTELRAKIGENNTATFESPFPGGNYDVVVENHNSTREAGVTQLGKYSIEVVEGTIGSPGSDSGATQ